MNKYNYYENEVGLTFNKYLAKTFMVLALGLFITAITSFVVARNFVGIFDGPFYMLAIFIQFGIAIYFGTRITKMSTTSAWISFIVYALITGITFSLILLGFEFSSVAMAFGITSIAFVSMSIIGYTTEIDLTKFSTYLFIGLISLVVITLLNAFVFKSEGLDLLLMYGGVLIFLGLTAFDVQKLKNMYYELNNDEHLLNNFMIFGAFQLYLDFINLFIYILRIFGRRK